MGLLDGLATAIRFRLSSLSAGPDAMPVGGVFTGGPAVACGPVGPAGEASSGRLTHRWCAAWKLVGRGWPSAAMMPILLKSVGGDKPQNRVRKSTRFCVHDALLVLAMQADDEAARRDDDMDHLAC
jgi:hypothetical protein